MDLLVTYGLAFVVALSLLICISVLAGVGFGPGLPGLKTAFVTAAVLAVIAVGAQLIMGDLPYALFLAAFLSGCWLKIAKDSGAPETVKAVAIGLTAVLTALSLLAGFVVLGAFLFLSALAGAASESTSASGTK